MQGVVVLVMRERPDGWSVELMLFHGLNVVSCEVVSVRHHTPLIRSYLALSKLENLLDLEEALDIFLGKDPIVLRDLNAVIERMQNPRIQQVIDLLASFGLVDLLSHFRQRIRLRHLKAWWQVQKGTFLCSLCDYILVSDLRLFKTVGMRDPRNFASDHFAICAQLLQRPT